MKKIIFSMTLALGMVLTSGSGSKLLAGDGQADVIETMVNTTRELQESWCRTVTTASRIDSDSDSEKSSNKCNVSDIINWNKIDLSKFDVDRLLNSMAEFFACVEDNGSNECAVKYCKCLSRGTELRCRMDQRSCIIRSISR